MFALLLAAALAVPNASAVAADKTVFIPSINAENWENYILLWTKSREHGKKGKKE